MTDAHEMLAVASYSTLSLTLEQLASYDVTNLFSLYVDGVAVPVTEDMIDVGQLQNAQEGGRLYGHLFLRRGGFLVQCRNYDKGGGGSRRAGDYSQRCHLSQR